MWKPRTGKKETRGSQTKGPQDLLARKVTSGLPLMAQKRTAAKVVKENTKWESMTDTQRRGKTNHSQHVEGTESRGKHNKPERKTSLGRVREPRRKNSSGRRHGTGGDAYI